MSVRPAAATPRPRLQLLPAAMPMMPPAMPAPTAGAMDAPPGFEELVERAVERGKRPTMPVKVKTDGLILGARIGPALFLFDDTYDAAAGSLFEVLKKSVEQAAAEARAPSATRVDVERKTASGTVVRIRARREGGAWRTVATATTTDASGTLHTAPIVPVGDQAWDLK